VVGPVAWANLRGHRIPALLIALTLAACGGLLTFGVAAQAASGNGYDRLWHATNGADLWLYLDAGRVTPPVIDDALAHTAGVTAWSPPQPQAGVAPVGIEQNSFSSGFALRDWPADPRMLGHPQLVTGRPPRLGDGDVIVLDVNVARSWRRGVGSTVGIATPAGTRMLRVVGLEADAEQCPYPLCGPQTLFLARVSTVRDAITGRLPVGSVGFAGTASTTRQFSSLGYAAQSGLLLAFAAVAAVASILLIVVAIGGAVRADSRRIGLLKAVGFSTSQLRATMLAEYVGLALLGAASGAAAASVVASRLLAPVTGQFGAGPPAVPWRAGVLAVAAIAIVVGAVVVVASRRSVRLDAASALRSDATGGNRATSLLPGPVVLSRAVGEIAAGRARSALTGLVLAVAAGALVMSVLFQANLGDFIDRLAFDGARTGDLVVRTSDQLSPDRAQSVMRGQAGVTGVVLERNVNFTVPGSTDTLVLRLRSGDLAALPQPLVSGRELDQPGEVVVGYGLAHKHHLRLGDDLSVGVAGTARTLRVVGIDHEINNLGQTATTLAATVPDARPLDQPVYLVHLRQGTDGAAVASRIKTTTGGLMVPTVVSASILPPLLRSIRPVIGALATVLALLTALGVFNAVLLGVQERRREYGLVRAVGMSQRQVLAVAVAGTLMLALAACVVAVPLAIVGGSALLNAVQAGIGIGPLSAPVPPLAFAVGPAVLAVALLGALGPAWSASRTSVTMVLREL
jgi:putative ABC transport system permease protein